MSIDFLATGPAVQAARALAQRDGIDYFEVGNAAGIDDYLAVATAALAVAREAGDGVLDAELACDPIALGSCARALADLDGDTAFRDGDQDAMSKHLGDARALLSALAVPAAMAA